MLATTRLDLSAQQIELFFKWLKTTLPCHHWLAESPDGVAIQIHCLLIATLLLFLWSGRPPNKRQMEALRFYWMGFIDEAERRVPGGAVSISVPGLAPIPNPHSPQILFPTPPRFGTGNYPGQQQPCRTELEKLTAQSISEKCRLAA